MQKITEKEALKCLEKGQVIKIQVRRKEILTIANKKQYMNKKRIQENGGYDYFILYRPEEGDQN